MPSSHGGRRQERARPAPGRVTCAQSTPRSRSSGSGLPRELRRVRSWWRPRLGLRVVPSQAAGPARPGPLFSRDPRIAGALVGSAPASSARGGAGSAPAPPCWRLRTSRNTPPPRAAAGPPQALQHALPKLCVPLLHGLVVGAGVAKGVLQAQGRPGNPRRPSRIPVSRAGARRQVCEPARPGVAGSCGLLLWCTPESLGKEGRP